MRFALVSVVLGLGGLSMAAESVASFDAGREYSHRIWRVQDGLPQNRIQSISQTADGYLWIGTSGGLVRFDGSRFFVFDRSNTPAFHDDSILSLSPSKDGSLWIGTEGGWLLRYQGGSFETFDAKSGLTNGFVRALHEDSRGILWIGTDRGFFRRDHAKIERMDDRNGIPITAITSITEDLKGRVWAAAGVGLLLAENGVLRQMYPENEVLKRIRGVRATRDGHLWLLTLSGVWRYEDISLMQHRPVDATIPLTLSEDHEGNLWIGTLGRGLIRSGAKGAVALRTPGILPDNTVFAIFEDRESNLWIGTQDGLLRMSRTAVHMLTSRDGIADENISSLYQDREGTLWLVTITGQIYRYRNGHLSPFQLPKPAAGLRVRVVYQDHTGAFWFGTSDNGVLRVEGNGLRIFNSRDGLRNNTVRQILEDHDGQVWIALGSGLSRWDGQRFHNYYLEDGLAYGSLRALLQDRGGDLIAGTDGGLNRIHNGKFVRDEAFAALGAERVWALYEDSEGALWAGTRGGGLFRIKQGQTRKITTNDGLMSNTIYGLLEDERGSFWMSTPAGVFSAPRAELNRVADNPTSGAIAVVSYGTADGLESAQMNGGIGSSAWRTSSGELWFSSVKGVVRINPSEVTVTHPSPVVIESISADDKPIPLSSSIRIPPGHGKLRVEYTAPSLLSPERVTFQYKLEGLEEAWNTAGSHRVAYYTNLPPGDYRFRVIARDSATPLQASEASIPFAWSPNFYQTGWFYALCAVLAALPVLFFLRLYARQAKARYAVLLAERTRLAREMHDTVIQGCVGVSTLLEAASGFQQMDQDRAKELVDRARVQVRLTLDEARQAVWDLRHNQLEGDITTTIRDLANQLSAEKGIPINVDLTGAPSPLQDVTLRGLVLVAREAVRNAVNHAAPKSIRIAIQFESQEVRLEVVDDGLGFTPSEELEETQRHYGIVGMRERVEQLGGKFSVQSHPGQGTSVVVCLPVEAVHS